MDALRGVLGVLDAALRDEQTQALFGEPVDPVALGLDDYFDVVKDPADLGTIRADVKASLAGKGPYKHPKEVADAIARVWSNCLLYNDRPADKPVRDAATRSKALLDKAWSAAGLHREAATPPPAPGAARVWGPRSPCMRACLTHGATGVLASLKRRQGCGMGEAARACPGPGGAGGGSGARRAGDPGAPGPGTEL